MGNITILIYNINRTKRCNCLFSHKKYLILILFVLCICVYAEGRHKENQYTIAIAEQLVNDGEYRQAIKVLNKCDYRAFVDALRMEAYNGIGKTRKAIRHGVKYLEGYSKQDSLISWSSYVLTDLLEIFEKDWEYSAKLMHKSLSKEEYRTQVLIVLGRLYYNNGYYEKAIEQYRVLEKYLATKGLETEAPICDLISSSYCALKDYDKAIEAVNACLNTPMGKNDYDVICQRGYCYLLAGRYEEAIEDYTRAIQLNPQYTFGNAYFGRSASLYQQEKLAEAKADYEKGLSFNPEMEYLPSGVLEIMTKISKGI